MRGLKALVIGMGGLIVAGVILLVVAAVQQAGDVSSGGEPAPSVPAVPAAGIPTDGPATPRTLEIPPGAEIVETRIADGRILLRLRLADGGGRLILLDAATGATTGSIDIRPQ
ncbi:MAG: hypothetical protein WD470_07760 [Rhodospirillaceae bacterium]